MKIDKKKVLALASDGLESDTSVIIWHSDPVKSGETVLLNGHNFKDDCEISLKLLSGDSKNQKSLNKVVKPLVATPGSVKFVIPVSWAQGIYSCVVAQRGTKSNEVLINAPDVWWRQGDYGIDTASPGGWLRLQGKCLVFEKEPVALLTVNGQAISLEVEKISSYSVKIAIPADLTPGRHQIHYGNGYGGDTAHRIIDLIVSEHVTKRPMEINVCDFKADPTGKKDSTVAIVDAILTLGGHGGGIVYFPAGRYRVDSIMGLGIFAKSPLKIPRNVTLRGESMETVSLWWPDQENPLPALIEGGSDFAVEELSIYTQGKHSTIIAGESNVTINRVRIRANCYYMTLQNGKAHHDREIDVDYTIGPAISIWGENLRITNCDIFSSGTGIWLKHTHGAYIRNNTIKARNGFCLCGCSEIIFEHNTISGNQLTAGGNNFALFFGGKDSKHVYFAHNSVSDIYGGDHEALTFDGQGCAYLGKIKKIDGAHFELTGELQAKSGHKGAMHNIIGAATFIIEGKGRGQYRWIKDHDGSRIMTDSPWLVEPDENSLVMIGAFNGRHLIIGNTMCDTGTAVQLYPPNYECVVAENRTARTSNFNCLSKFRTESHNDFVRCEPSWYNQFLANEILEGNGWGGGGTEIDGWLGGETWLLIWGWQVNGYLDENGTLKSHFMTPSLFKETLKEASVRAISIPICLFTIVRRHKIHNNSSIRIRGRVSEALIENCEINQSDHGIRVDSELDYGWPQSPECFFDNAPADPDELKGLNFLSPDHILLRNNSFERTRKNYSGNALSTPSIRVE